MAKVEVEIRSMKMDVGEPPWANELLVRNRKVGRTIWSTSDIHQGKTSLTFELPKGGDDEGENTHGRKRTEDKKVTDPTSASQATRTVLQKANSHEVEDVFEPWSSCQNLGPGGDMRENPWKISCNSGEESILEYGPGIVSKLRSKYQSLAARQPSIRPSLLHRSSSFEHSLDFVHTEVPARADIRAESLSPGPVKEITGRDDRGGRTSRLGMTLSARPTTTYGKLVNNNTINVRPHSRGRSIGNIEQQNRMRRARSVDSLQYVEYTRQEEEILEKLKNVVLPKEEVVIIEMSKPRLNLGNLENGFGNTQQNVFNTLISPEHELPPHYIVRDTARKFETNPGGHQWKKVGHVLKACKSPSFSPNSSVCSSPTRTSPAPVITSTEKKIQVVPAQPQQRPILSEIEDCPKAMNNLQQANNKLTSKTTAAEMGINFQNNSPGKQVGIIRPTINGVQKSVSASNLSRPRAPPPIRETPSPNRAFQFITPPTKPPLGPKPILSPKSKESDQNTYVPNIAALSESNENGIEIQRPLDLKLNLNVHTNLRGRSPTSTQVSPKGSTPSPNGEVKSPVAIKNTTTFPVKLKPVGSTTTSHKTKESLQKQSSNSTNTNATDQSVSYESQNHVSKQPYNDTSNLSTASKASDSPAINSTVPKVNIREGDALKKPKTTPLQEPKKETESVPAVSQLRSHQKQKLQQNNGGGSMVFNFTSRVKVPDYIEDDGLHLSRGNSNAADDLVDDAVDGSEKIDPKLIQFIGANVIINGKSSIQKKPKSQKMSIRFNEEGTTTFEYPSEASVLKDDDTGSCNTSGSNNNLVMANPISPGTLNNLTGGGALSNYTPSKVAPNSYQLGFYRENAVTDSNSNRKSPTDLDSNGDVIEDYLKPDTGNTTWSNEIGGADILF